MALWRSRRCISLAKERGIALAVLPADGRDDPRLDALSTLPLSTLRRLKTLCDKGGATAAQAAIAQLALAAGLLCRAGRSARRYSRDGFYDPARGVSDDTAGIRIGGRSCW